MKQLGLVHYVYPSADYSRFAHALGTCHMASQMYTAIYGKKPEKDFSDELQLHRLAGLLHDVGHYPLSHPFENALLDHYSQTMIVEKGSGKEESEKEQSVKTPLRHVAVGGKVIQLDSDLSAALKKGGVEPAQIVSLLLSEEPPHDRRLPALISSDLDADRIDYLLRTALHTGLPYGHVDIQYLLTQLRCEGGRICFETNALRTVEHMLLGRYFDYRQVSHHRVVAGFEQMLQRVIDQLLESHALELSKDDVEEMIVSRKWASLDDESVWRLIVAMAAGEAEDPYNALARAIVDRKPAAQIWAWERQEKRTNDDTFRLFRRRAIERIPEWAEETKTPIESWFVWAPQPVEITKVGSMVPVASKEEEERIEQVVAIKGKDGLSLITTMKESLMYLLADYALFSIRIYLLIPEGRPEVRDQARDLVDKAMAVK